MSPRFSELAVTFTTKTDTEVPEAMPPPTALSIRRRVLALRREGYRQADVAYVVGMSQSAVCKILRRHREMGHLRPRKSPGRPRLTTRRDDRRLLNLCRRNWKMPASSLRRLWRRHYGINFSRQTVNRRLLQHGFRAR